MNNKNIVNSIIYLIKELLDMGDDYELVVDISCINAELEYLISDAEELIGNKDFEDCKTENEVIDKMFYMAYEKIVENKPDMIKDLLVNWEYYGYYNTFIKNLTYERVDKIEDSNIYKNLKTLLEYVKSTDIEEAVVNNLESLVNSLKNIDVDAINIGYDVARTYLPKLSKKFGIYSNDVFSIGHVITPDNEEEFPCYKGYSYVFHKDINQCGGPDTPLCALVKSDTDNVYLKILMSRRGQLQRDINVVGVIGYIYDFGTLKFKKDTSIEIISDTLADKYNQLIDAVYDIADKYPTLYKIKLYDDPLENILQ